MMQLFRHCTVVALLLVGGSGAFAQTRAVSIPAAGEASFVVYVRGVEVGRVQSNLAQSGSAWVLTSTGRVGDVVLNRFELKYSADWQPIELRLEATQPPRHFTIASSFGVTTAINELTQNGVTTAKTDQISARTVVLPNNFFAAYEALAVRLSESAAGDVIPVYVVPQAEVNLTVKDVAGETLQTPYGTATMHKYAVALQNPGAAVEATVTVDSRRRFAGLEMPASGLSVVRTDIAGVGTRVQSARNPTDVDVTIPVAGFNLAGTLTTPRGSTEGRLRHPTVLLIAGSGSVDRDETVAGIPIFAQLAGSLAERGFMVLRYDKRGIGQSGGRTEAATLQDYADDAVEIVRWLAKRDDVDSRRLAVAGHSEGGSIAMLAAAKEKKIDSVILMAAPGTTGADLILEQQQHQLEAMKLPASERQQKIDLQRRIHTAVLTEKGWEGVPDDLRRQADTPWFRSVLQFDPARTMSRFKQPVLIVQGDLDTQVPAHHAEQLAALARARKKAGGVAVVHVPGVNHLLTNASTGEVQEYATLAEKHVSPQVATAIADWLNKQP